MEIKAITDAESQLQALVKAAGANGKDEAPIQLPAVEQPTAQVYDFAELGQKVADTLERAAQEQLDIAQKQLDKMREFNANLMKQIKEKAAELEEMNKRLGTFGGSILDAYHVFNANGKNAP